MSRDPNNPTGADSIWTYHVWNDVYMARPDLPPGYGGWQAVDSTPQEKSDGLYQCGPASLEAIREGQAGFKYDVPFMVASVNADCVDWVEDETTEFGYRRLHSDTKNIGSQILTKKPYIFDPVGDKDKEDIISSYKNTEGTPEERTALLNAVRKCGPTASRFYELPMEAPSDVSFKMADLEIVNIGDPFTVLLEIQNESDEPRTVEIYFSIDSVFYNGVMGKNIRRSAEQRVIEANQMETVLLEIKPEDYVLQLVENSIIKVLSICKVEETHNAWSGNDDFQIIKPNINVSVESELNVDQEHGVTLSFKNPLHIELTDCVFKLSSPGLIEKAITLDYQNVGPEEELSIHTSITPWVS